MGIQQLRASTGLSQKGFSEAFQIPVRTLQQWEQGKSSPAPYVLAMMEKLAPAMAADAPGEKDPYFVPEKSRWKVCIPDPFPNCERVYPLQQRKVRQLLDALRGNDAVKSVTIFGSSVPQRCRQDSDLDVYLELADGDGEVKIAFDFPCDLWTNRTADERLKREIEQKGVRVYG